MILYRYLLKDIFSHTVAVGLVFLFIVLSSRSIQYLEQVSRGELNADLVFWVILFRLPEFLQVIIPFAFFLGIILVIGKLYSDSEMPILEQNGFSISRFLGLFSFAGTFLALIVGIFSLLVTPIFNEKLNQIYLNTSFADNFHSIKAGRFNFLDNLSIIYAKEKEGDTLKNVFLKFEEKKKFPANNFITAETAYLSEAQSNVLVLERGFSFSEDKINKVEMEFDSLILNLSDKYVQDLTSTISFKEGHEIQYTFVDLQWRLSIPLLCLISPFLAFPLSKVKPRQGRFTRVLPSILVFMSYLGLLLLVRGWVEEGILPSFPGLLTVHVLFLAIGLLLLFRHSRLARSS